MSVRALPSEPASTWDVGVAKRRKTRSRAQFIDGILSGDRAILAQAITLIESSRRRRPRTGGTDCRRLSLFQRSFAAGWNHGCTGCGQEQSDRNAGQIFDRRPGSEPRRAGHRSVQPTEWRKHSGRQDAHGIAGLEREGFHPAFALARLFWRRGAAYPRGDAFMRGGGLPEHPGRNRRRGTIGNRRSRHGRLSLCLSCLPAPAMNCRGSSGA